MNKKVNQEEFKQQKNSTPYYNKLHWKNNKSSKFIRVDNIS